MRAAVVAEAREWIGTPYAFKQCLKGVAVDCGYFIVGVGRGAGVLTASDEDLAPFRDYGKIPNGNHMRRFLDLFFEPLGDTPPGDGDIAWFSFDARPWGVHFAILATLPDGRVSMIHADGDQNRVVEHGFGGEWPSRVVSFWRFPGVR